MTEYQYITLRNKPKWMVPASEWFHSKWRVPAEVYLECMEAYLRGETEHKYLIDWRMQWQKKFNRRTQQELWHMNFG